MQLPIDRWAELSLSLQMRKVSHRGIVWSQQRHRHDPLFCHFMPRQSLLEQESPPLLLTSLIFVLFQISWTTSMLIWDGWTGWPRACKLSTVCVGCRQLPMLSGCIAEHLWVTHYSDCVCICQGLDNSVSSWALSAHSGVLCSKIIPSRPRHGVFLSD